MTKKPKFQNYLYIIKFRPANNMEENYLAKDIEKALEHLKKLSEAHDDNVFTVHKELTPSDDETI